MKFIIGNGSLIKQASLNRTCPAAKIIAPCIVRGWRRNLDLRSTSREDPEAGVCANVINSEPGGEDDWFNGVFIHVPDEEYDALLKREKLYVPTPVQPYHYDSNEALPQAAIWVSDHPKTEVPWQVGVQDEYIQICVDGCQAISEKYLQDFLETTYAEGQRLVSHPQFDITRYV